MKKILYINQYFKTPSEPGITRSYWIAQSLIKAGYSVTMLAHRNTRLEHIGKAASFSRENIDGIDVIYLRNQYSNDMGTFQRAWAFVSFMLRACFHALKEKKVDLVIATSTPLTVAVPARVRKFFKKTPYLFEVRDLWPEVPIQMGAVKSKFLIRFLRNFERKTYEGAEHVVALSPGMQEGVCKYVAKEKTSMIPNMAKIDQFWPRGKNTERIASMGLSIDSFKVLYFGQMGLSNAIPYILDAAEFLKEELDVEFLFVGHGRMMKAVKERVEKMGLNQIHCFDRVAMQEMSEIVNFCDVSLVTFSNIPILATNSPNKLFDSISGGLPVIVNSPGWTKNMVEEHQCGLFADPTSPRDLADKILCLKTNPGRFQMMAGNARKLAEEVYDKSILCEQFKTVVDRLFSEMQLPAQA